MTVDQFLVSFTVDVSPKYKWFLRDGVITGEREVNISWCKKKYYYCPLTAYYEILKDFEVCDITYEISRAADGHKEGNKELRHKLLIACGIEV